MTEAELAAQIEWFHQLAALPPDQLALQASEANRSAFANLVGVCLPDHSAPEGQSPEEFASTVLALRENERQWNRALSSALIQADELHKSQGWQHAVTTLEAFAASCPWKLFREVAGDQAGSYGSRT